MFHGTADHGPLGARVTSTEMDAISGTGEELPCSWNHLVQVHSEFVSTLLPIVYGSRIFLASPCPTMAGGVTCHE